jgi:DHA1 family bicyclomycin/chloramphenicol resistance-like MFS transporter
MVLALEEHGAIAGIASALGGTLQMVTGGIMIVIVSAVSDGGGTPVVTTIALCAIGALLLSVATMAGANPRRIWQNSVHRHRPRPPQSRGGSCSIKNRAR